MKNGLEDYYVIRGIKKCDSATRQVPAQLLHVRVQQKYY